MKQLIYFLYTLPVFFNISAFSQNIEWQKCYGGSSYDQANFIQQTTDKGYFIMMTTQSSDEELPEGPGDDDIWIVKLTSTKEVEWQRRLGGMYKDIACQGQQTGDGGYIITGWSNSIDGGVSGSHGGIDIWILKLRSDGKIQWKNCFGGSEDDFPKCVRQTTDGGYIIAGYTNSDNGNVSKNNGRTDIWVVKLKPNGNINWKKCLGGSKNDYSYSIRETPDGGYILAGGTYSGDGNVTENRGSSDLWIVKLSDSGKIEFQRSFGGSNYDIASDILLTNDGGYIIAGSTQSTDGDVTGNHGSVDGWVLKLNSSYEIEWQKCYGGSNRDFFDYFLPAENGYILAGGSLSHDGDVTGNYGQKDIWIVRIDTAGKIEWQKNYGGSGKDTIHSIQPASDNGYIISADTYSNDNDVTGNHGENDGWIFKIK